MWGCSRLSSSLHMMFLYPHRKSQERFYWDSSFTYPVEWWQRPPGGSSHSKRTVNDVMQAAPWPTAAVGLEEVGLAKALCGVRVQHFTINRMGTLRTERNLGRDEMFVALRVTCWGRLRMMLEILFHKSGMLKALLDHFRTFGSWWGTDEGVIIFIFCRYLLRI